MAVLLFLGVGASVRAALIMDSPTTGWTAVLYGTAYPDWYGDQQTGITDSDIVGTNNLPALYYTFDKGDTNSLTDGQLGLRMRLASGGSTFPKVAHVGIDADRNGSIDVFISVDNAGNPDRIRIFDSGTGQNISPNTTSIDSQHPYVSYAEAASNYSYTAVSAATDPAAFTYDAGADGNTDYFLSWSIPFQDLVDFLSLKKGITIDEGTALTLIAATATQPNSLNEDINGPPKSYSGTATWAQLGAESYALSVDGTVPEPGSILLLLCGGGLLCCAFMRAGQPPADEA